MSGRRVFRAPPPAGEASPQPEPTFSVVIPTFNSAATIREAVDSALAQTTPPLEVIVSDDGSTDETPAVLEPYGDRIGYLRNVHRGAATARNAALEVARGDFVVLLDADDSYAPERLEALGDLAAARPDLDILCTDLLFEVDGRPAGTFEATCPFETLDQRAAILERCFCPVPAVRRTALVEVGGFDTSLETADDWECAARLIHAGASAGLVDEPLYRYRIHDDSLTGDRIRTLRERVTFLERFSGDERLRSSEREALERSLARQRRSLLLTETEASLRARDASARGHALALARSRGSGAAARVAGLGAALAPGLAARILERRVRVSGHTRLGRSYPRR